MKDDVISRQAAIDAIDNAAEHWNLAEPYHEGIRTGYKNSARLILSLPSVQRWIPCSERLPKNRQYVLVTYQYEYGLIDHGITWYGEAEKKWNTSRNVTAWMPLPEPYKGD